jgi:hypothetical protein
LKRIDGSSDKFLAAGIYGYQMANAAELMRGYPGWAAADFRRFKTMMLTVFYPLNRDFLIRHNGACISHYWANWDQVNMAAMLSIGILADSQAIFDESIRYAKTGAGNGSIKNSVWYLHPDNLGQWQESGRDQGHSLMGPAILGAICEMAWNQGEDLYGFDDNRALKGFEYVARYNLEESVPYQPYDNCDNVDQRVISAASRGGNRPGWELVYNHYVNRRGLAAPYCQRYAQRVRPEGGGGDYGPNSGGYDQLGYGTLTATIPRGVSAVGPEWLGGTRLSLEAREGRLTIRAEDGILGNLKVTLADLNGRALPALASSTGGSILHLDVRSLGRRAAVLAVEGPSGSRAQTVVTDR